MSLFHPTTSRLLRTSTACSPAAAMPGGEIELHGTHLDPSESQLPHASIG